VTDDDAARSRWSDRFLLLAAIEAVAVAWWLRTASVHIVGWPSSGPLRLALLAPTWQMLVSLAVGLVVAGGLMVSGRAGAASRVLRPLLILWAFAIPYLPWLPDRLPLLLVLAGPIRWVLAAIALLRVAQQGVGTSGVEWAFARVGRRTVFAVSLAVYVVFGLWSVTANGLGGDEPHYLVITESLLRDGDLQIENNHQRGDYRSFFQGELRPDYMQRGQNGQIYSIHAPGLPALLLPAYAVAGYRGAVVFIAWLAALTALAVFDLAALVGGQRAATLTWVGVCLTVPFVPHSWSIFPEMPGALLAAWASLWLMQQSDTPTPVTWALRGSALALLPWLHTKFIVLLAVFAVGIGLRLLRRPDRLIAFGAPMAVSCAAWLYSFYAMYGRFDPEAPYGAYTRIYVLTSNIPHGLLGLFFDQKFGLLVYSPIYLAMLAGVWLGLRETKLRFSTAILVIAVAAFVGSTARLYMFWGGSSAPGRFFVPILPCMAPFIALAIARYQSALSRALVGLWLAIGIGIAAVGIVDPARFVLFSDPHGRARILEILQAGSPLALVVPTFTEPTWATQVVPLTLWMAAAAAALVVLLVAARVARASALTLAGAASAAFLIGGAVLTARPAVEVREATATRGDLDVLWRYDGQVFRTLDYQSLSRATPERFRDLTTLHIRPEVAPDARPPFESNPLNLPPGRFDASVWFSSPRTREGEILVSEPRATYGSIAGSLSNPATFDVTIPAPTRRTQIRVPDLELARSIGEIRLVPQAVVPATLRDPRPARLIESVQGRPGAYLVYTDGEAYPEMGTFWSRGTAATTVLVVPNGASRIALTLSTGPMNGSVTVSFSKRTEQVPMSANQAQTIALDVPAGARLVPLTIQSDVMFRPSEVNPDSRDARGLGCQVHVALE
jgi:hypothetical protein